MKAIHITRLALMVMGLLLIPLMLTMLNSNPEGQGFNWGSEDFIVSFIILFGAGLMYQFVSNKATTPRSRIITAGAIAITVFLIWIELAVDGVSQLIHSVAGL